MSSMLIDDRPIMFLPLLAKALGSCERAIVLQQIHWLLRQPNSGMWDDDGVHWVWGTYEEWCEDYFPMWSPPSLKRHIQLLEKGGVLISARLRAHEHNQTKFYRINYAHEFLNQTDAPMGQHVIPSNEHNVDSSNRPDVIPSSISTETSSKTTQKDKRPTRAQRGKDHADNSRRRKSYKPDAYDYDD